MAPNIEPIILASASPRRSALLAEAGIKFTVCQPVVEEVHGGHYTVREMVLLNALLKARAVSKVHPGRIVLAADTLVTLDGDAMGKPRNIQDAEKMLARLSGRTHEVLSGVCLIRREDNRRASFFEITSVTFHPLSPGAIRHYLTRVDPMDKAGAYAAQEDKGELISHMQGSRSNVTGLPMERLLEMLDTFRSPARKA